MINGPSSAATWRTYRAGAAKVWLWLFPKALSVCRFVCKWTPVLLASSRNVVCVLAAKIWRSLAHKLLALSGLAFTFAGALVSASGVIVTNQQAARNALSGGMLVGPSIQEAIHNNPAVQSLMDQSHKAALGLVLIAFGTLLQLIDLLVSGRRN